MEREQAELERKKEEEERKKRREEAKRQSRILEAAFDGDNDEILAALEEVSQITRPSNVLSSGLSWLFSIVISVLSHWSISPRTLRILPAIHLHFHLPLFLLWY